MTSAGAVSVSVDVSGVVVVGVVGVVGVVVGVVVAGVVVVAGFVVVVVLVVVFVGVGVGVGVGVVPPPDEEPPPPVAGALNVNDAPETPVKKLLVPSRPTVEQPDWLVVAQGALTVTAPVPAAKTLKVRTDTVC